MHKVHFDCSWFLLSTLLNPISCPPPPFSLFLSLFVSLYLYLSFFIISHWVQLVLSMCTWAWGCTLEHGWSISSYTPQRKMILLSLSSDNRSSARSMALWAPSPSALEFRLAWSCAGLRYHSFCGFISTRAMSYPEDIIPQCLSPSSSSYYFSASSFAKYWWEFIIVPFRAEL